MPAPRHSPATDPRQSLSGPLQAGQLVGELGRLDLCRALRGAGVFGEDVEIQRGAVHHADAVRSARSRTWAGLCSTTTSASSSSTRRLSSSTFPEPR